MINEKHFVEWKAAEDTEKLVLGLPSACTFHPEDGGDFTPKRRLIFNGLHDVITTATRTADPSSRQPVLGPISSTANPTSLDLESN
jgi:hypothetical protein